MLVRPHFVLIELDYSVILPPLSGGNIRVRIASN